MTVAGKRLDCVGSITRKDVDMIIYLYRWRIDPAKQDHFVTAWSDVTAHVLKTRQPGVASAPRRRRLVYGYAQWPSAEARQNAGLDSSDLAAALRLMREATLESLPEVELTPVRDFLRVPS